MSNTPNNPLNPLPPEKGPWMYSGGQQPVYTPPPASPPAVIPPPAAVAPGGAAEGSAIKPAVVSHARPSKPAPAPVDDASVASIVDTIEAIIIALILALTFRAFVIEAFVIPTGSMAPTLLGAHFNVICPECGYVFTRDASLNYQEVSGKVMSVGDHAELGSNTAIPADGDLSSLVCPNCQYVIPYNKMQQYLDTKWMADDRANRERAVPFAWANNGDRILVLKYLYSIMEPARFDVIVFKEPMFAKDNFIKRLIGLPGETVEIVGGDIYTAAPGKLRPEDRQIARKPEYMQRDLWQLVYDNDHYPQDEGQRRASVLTDQLLRDYYLVWHNPWVGAGDTAAAWNKENAKTADGSPLETVGGPVIHYRGKAPGTLAFNPQHRRPYGFNILGYNNDIEDLHNGRDGTLRPVGDLRVATTWTPAEAGGATVSLIAGSRGNLFKVTWSAGGVELRKFDHAKGDYEAVEGAAKVEHAAPEAGKSYNIAMNNADHTVQFFIDGSKVLEHITPWNAADAYRLEDEIDAAAAQMPGPRVDVLSEVINPQAEVSVGGACTLGHLKVFRDLYYTQTEQGLNTPRYPGAANQNHPLTLGPGEYFAMGDNSRRSNDGRTWDRVDPPLDDLGTWRGVVPQRYLLGKAVFVYWPAGYRFSDKLAIWPLVPNTGDMRFIR